MAQAHTSRFQSAEYARTYYVYTVEAKTPYEALFEPAYWAHICSEKGLRAYDVIEVRTDEGLYFAQLLVLQADRLSARVAEIAYADLTKARASQATAASSGVRIRYAGPHHKWRIERVSDSAVIQHGFADEISAQVWMADNRKSLAA